MPYRTLHSLHSSNILNMICSRPDSRQTRGVVLTSEGAWLEIAAAQVNPSRDYVHYAQNRAIGIVVSAFPWIWR